jgi:hypothetical protein
MSTINDHVEVDPTDIGIALAMRNNGFSNEDVVSILGYMPDLSVTPEELEAAVTSTMRPANTFALEPIEFMSGHDDGRTAIDWVRDGQRLQVVLGHQCPHHPIGGLETFRDRYRSVRLDWKPNDAFCGCTPAEIMGRAICFRWLACAPIGCGVWWFLSRTFPILGGKHSQITVKYLNLLCFLAENQRRS